MSSQLVKTTQEGLMLVVFPGDQLMHQEALTAFKEQRKPRFTGQ